MAFDDVDPDSILVDQVTCGNREEAKDIGGHFSVAFEMLTCLFSGRYTSTLPHFTII